MARDAVADTALKSEAPTVTPAGTAINAANGGTIAAIKDASRVVLRFVNTFAGVKKITIKAGVNPPALRQGIGDLVLTLAQNEDVMLCIESARHLQADGSISIDYEAGTTGTASAVLIPKAV
jgi:hypothetical protein